MLTGTDRRHGTQGTFRLHACACGLVRTEPWPTDFASAYPSGEYMNHGEREGIAARVFRSVLDATATGRWPRPLAGAALAGVPAARLGGPLQPGARVLDVGAGSGHAVAAMIGAGLDAHGLEPSPDAVAVAHGAGLSTVGVGTLEDTALEERSWDLIRFWHTLEHVPSPVTALRAAHDGLRPGGRVVVGVPNFGSAGRRLFGADWDGLELPRHLHHFTPASLRAVLRAAGLAGETVRSAAVMGVLGGSIDARSRRGNRQRAVAGSAAVQLALHPLEVALALAGRGDGLVAVAHRPPDRG